MGIGSEPYRLSPRSPAKGFNFTSMEHGWVKLHRRLLKSAFFQRSQYVHLWVYLLLRANHEPAKFMWNNKVIVIKEGEFITGRKAMVEETGIPGTTVERILDFLEKEGQIGQQKTTKFRLITIVNWKTFQETDNRRTTDGQQTDTNKNNNNNKNNTEAVASIQKPPILNKPSQENTNTSFEEWRETECKETTLYLGEEEGEVDAWIHPSRKRPYTDKELRKLHNSTLTPSVRPKKVPRTNENFNHDTWLDSLRNSSNKLENIIALIWHEKGYKFDNYTQWRSQMDMDAVYAKKLLGYSGAQIKDAIDICQKESREMGYDWKASTVAKKIAQVLV